MLTGSARANIDHSDDELDDILNEIIDGGEKLKANDPLDQAGPKSLAQPEASKDGLGLDEEVKIVKKRQPIPKLDENRLLSDAGIPRLRRIGKDKMRFKGKGHEYSDIARMLNMYQLWLDDLYPRAKFADGLAMIEKLGHTKRIQMMRKEWIDEGKPRQQADADPEEEDIAAVVPVQSVEQPAEQMEGLALGSDSDRPQKTVHMGKDEASINMADVEEPDEDDLDALLAESVETGPMSQASNRKQSETAQDDDMYADDMEAMADMDMW